MPVSASQPLCGASGVELAGVESIRLESDPCAGAGKGSKPAASEAAAAASEEVASEADESEAEEATEEAASEGRGKAKDTPVGKLHSFCHSGQPTAHVHLLCLAVFASMPSHPVLCQPCSM